LNRIRSFAEGRPRFTGTKGYDIKLILADRIQSHGKALFSYPVSEVDQGTRALAGTHAGARPADDLAPIYSSGLVLHKVREMANCLVDPIP
jgi:hypothetical protein